MRPQELCLVLMLLLGAMLIVPALVVATVLGLGAGMTARLVYQRGASDLR